MFDYFGGKGDPRKMPSHFFFGAVHLDYASALKADVSKQDYSVFPRWWYIDASFPCRRCGETFAFTANEQRFWYEDLQFFIDSRPSECRKCRRELRELKALRQEYDRDITAALANKSDLEKKKRLIEVVEMLDSGGVKLPEKVWEHFRMLERQIEPLQ